MNRQKYAESFLSLMESLAWMFYFVTTMLYSWRYSSTSDQGLLMIPVSILACATAIVWSIRFYRSRRAKQLKKDEPDSLYVGKEKYGESFLSLLKSLVWLVYFVATLHYAHRYSSELDYALLMIPTLILVSAMVLVMSMRLHRYRRAKRLKKSQQSTLQTNKILS